MSSESNELSLEAVSACVPNSHEVWTWKNKRVYLVLEARADEYTLLNLCNGVVYNNYPLELFTHNMDQDGFWQRLV